MLRSTKSLFGFTLAGEDGELGTCEDFLFDDETWIVRYMVADTGIWLPKKKVLVSPFALGALDSQFKRIEVRLLREQIENAPPLDQDAPVSRQFEKQYASYYGYPPYWRGPSLWGITEFPRPLYEEVLEHSRSLEVPQGDPHLRSAKEIIGYRIQAADDGFGHVEDFILNQEGWNIQYMVIDTRRWLPGASVIVPTDWIQSVQWSEATIMMPFTKEQIRNAPKYNPKTPVNRMYETRLYDYYGRPHYW